jgi:hypothetical protein
MRLITILALCFTLGCGDEDEGAGDLDASADAAGADAVAAADATPPSMFGTRYCEVFLVKVQGADGTVEVYNTVGLNLCPASQWDALDTAKLKQEHNVFAVMLNGPRYWTTDGAKAGSSVGSTVVTFGGIDMKKVAEIKGTLAELAQLQAGATPYNSATVLRDNTWVYRAGREVYELVAPASKVYVMQSYSHQVDDTLSSKDLPGLGARLTLPTGWSFRARTLTATLELKASGTATVVQDELKNTYQLR